MESQDTEPSSAPTRSALNVVRKVTDQINVQILNTCPHASDAVNQVTSHGSVRAPTLFLVLELASSAARPDIFLRTAQKQEVKLRVLASNAVNRDTLLPSAPLEEV